jgi:pimeloyl-ACP methyl ester carboxylesterase
MAPIPEAPNNPEIVSIETGDGLCLTGALWTPAAGTSHTAIAIFPGTGGEFYDPLFIALGQQLSAAGFLTLSMNRRDHGQNFGFYRLHEAAMDLKLGIDLLMDRGAKQVVLGGHSYGTVTAPYYIAETDDGRVPGLLLLAILGDMRRASVLILGSEERYGSVVAEAEEMIAAGKGGDAFIIPPMVPGHLPMVQTYDVFLDKRGPNARTAPIDLIQQVGNRPLLGLRDPADPFPATLPPAQEMLEAANPNLEYRLLNDIRNGAMTPVAHNFQDREIEITEHILSWMGAHGFTS